MKYMIKTPIQRTPHKVRNYYKFAKAMRDLKARYELRLMTMDGRFICVKMSDEFVCVPR
ncbi:MAG: hypothetical protein ACUZ8I_14970 [Candidatus Scalindua sp.]